MAQRLYADGHRAIPIGQAQGRHRVFQRAIEGLQETRQGLIDGLVRYHRRDHGTQTDLVIGLCHGMGACDSRAGHFDEQVETGGTALADQFDCRELCA